MTTLSKPASGDLISSEDRIMSVLDVWSSEELCV